VRTRSSSSWKGRGTQGGHGGKRTSRPGEGGQYYSERGEGIDGGIVREWGMQ